MVQRSGCCLCCVQGHLLWLVVQQGVVQLGVQHHCYLHHRYNDWFLGWETNVSGSASANCSIFEFHFVGTMWQDLCDFSFAPVIKTHSNGSTDGNWGPLASVSVVILGLFHLSLGQRGACMHAYMIVVFKLYRLHALMYNVVQFLYHNICYMLYIPLYYIIL